MGQAANLGKSELDRAIEFVSPYCDLKDRLDLVPPSAKVRGLYLKAQERLLEERGKAGLYREFFPSGSWSSFKAYPLRDYLVHLAVGGACLHSPEKVHTGMEDIWRTYAIEFTQSLLGKTMLRMLSRDPMRMMEQAVAARRQMFLYGRWQFVRLGERRVEMVYEEEYIWIESALRGGAVGSFEACGVEAPIVETRMKDRFNGATRISW